MSRKDRAKNRLSTQDLCLAAIFAALTALLAQIAIPLPFSPVHFSLGMVGVYFSGILLTPRCAALSQVCYLLIGAIGLPVFGGFRGGLGTLFGPTGGYLMVYPIMALIVAVALNGARALRVDKPLRQTMIRGAGAIGAAQLVLYLGGALWLSAVTGATLVAALGLAVLPYIPLDMVKIVFCVRAGIPLRKRLVQSGVAPQLSAISSQWARSDSPGQTH